MEFLNALDPVTKVIILGAMVAGLVLLFVTRPRR